MRTTRLAALVALITVAGLVEGDPPSFAKRRVKPTPCPGGRFPVSDGPLVPGGAASDAVVVDGTEVSIESGCTARAARRKVSRKRTVLTTRWDGCGALTGRVTLKVTLAAPGCDQLAARFRNQKGRIDRRIMTQVETPGDAVGRTTDALPEGAVLVTEEEWTELQQRAGFHSLGPQQTAADQAAEAQSAAADEQTVATFLLANPALEAQYRGAVDPGDPTLQTTGDGNYAFTFTDGAGQPRTVVTHGPRFARASVAGAIRTFPAVENQLGLYDNFYEGLEAIDPALAAQYPTPAEAGQLAAADLRALNNTLIGLAGQYLGLVPPPGGTPPPGYPATCAAEEGSGDGTDQSGRTTCGTPKVGGIYANKTWPLKFFATCPKDQAARGTCWSFAVNGATELTVAKKYGRWINLAEQHLIHANHAIWFPHAYGDGGWPGAALGKILATGYAHPFEEQWDYNPSRSRIANDMTTTYRNSCAGYTSAERDFCSDTAGQGQVFCVNLLLFYFCAAAPPPLATTSDFHATEYGELWNPENINLSFGAIVWAVGIFRKPVVYSFGVAPSFYPGPNGYVEYRGPHCPVVMRDGEWVCTPESGCECDIGGHAVLITGLIDNSQLPAGAPPGSGGGYVIIKNSWSHCYGDAGYAYLPYDWVKAYGWSAVVLGDVN